MPLLPRALPLLLLLALLGVAPSLAATVTVPCHPPAEVWIPAAYTNARRDLLLGATGNPLPVPTDALLPRREYELQIRRAGYDTASLKTPLSADVVLQPLALVPATPGAWVESHPLLGMVVGGMVVGGTVVGGIVLAALFAVTRLRRSAAEDAQALAREEVREAPVSGDDPLPGASVAGYRVAERIGAGGMATVYRATRDGQEFALKMVHPELSCDEEFRRRLQREFKVCSTLRHPAIVRAVASGEEDGRLYLVLELVRGEPLATRIAPGGLPPAEALALLGPVFDAVQAAHEAGVVHRDLKPENVVCGHAVKVMDFGLARGQAYSRLTQTGSFVGTPAYAAPEQITQAAGDGRVDE
ncbi:MAG: serine/threonine protein kinase, partial [Armatimonadetes bacterium]|nr:serine/threonine protein kinase [Armatimonadota bacterium]